MSVRSERRAEQLRAYYPDGRPTEEARSIHRRWVASPIPRLMPTAGVLDVAGRVSGRTIRVPVVLTPYRGRWYVVAMLGQEVNWVRNVRAAHGDAVLLHGRRRPVHLVEVPTEQRAPIIRRFLLVAPGARPHLPVTWHSPLPAVAAVAQDYPVFRVDRR